jgi:hypothetical protein
MAGKGSRRRPTNVPTEQADANYETIFGKYVPLYLRKQLPDADQFDAAIMKNEYYDQDDLSDFEQDFKDIENLGTDDLGKIGN